jgi:hypothetical protein
MDKALIAMLEELRVDWRVTLRSGTNPEDWTLEIVPRRYGLMPDVFLAKQHRYYGSLENVIARARDHADDDA